MRPLNVVAADHNNSFTCNLTLKQIQKELKKMTDLAHQGIDIDEARFDYLLRAQENNEEYKLLVAEERAAWRDSVYEFAEQCLERTRSFVPLNIFESSQDDLIAVGLTPELAKRVLQRQCLWLTRMSKAEIASLHESDLIGRFNSSAQNMDIIETAAIYVALPDQFNSDDLGRKSEWRDVVEDNLRRMLQDNDNGTLPEGRIRHPVYEGMQFGPVEDVTSVRETDIVSGRHSHRPRRSFLEVCKAHSILSSINLKAEPVDDSSDSSDSEGFEDEYEEDGDADEEEVYVVEGDDLKLSEEPQEPQQKPQQPDEVQSQEEPQQQGQTQEELQEQPQEEPLVPQQQFQRATSYLTRDYIYDSDEGGEEEAVLGEDPEEVTEEEEEVEIEGDEGDTIYNKDMNEDGVVEAKPAENVEDADRDEIDDNNSSSSSERGEQILPSNTEFDDDGAYEDDSSSSSSESSAGGVPVQDGDYDVEAETVLQGDRTQVVDENIASYIDELTLAESAQDQTEYCMVDHPAAAVPVLQCREVDLEALDSGEIVTLDEVAASEVEGQGDHHGSAEEELEDDEVDQLAEYDNA